MYWIILETWFIIRSCLLSPAGGNLFSCLPELSLWFFPTLMFQSELIEIVLIISLTSFSKLSRDEELRINWMEFSFLLFSWIQMFAHSFISEFDTQYWQLFPSMRDSATRICLLLLEAQEGRGFGSFVITQQQGLHQSRQKNSIRGLAWDFTWWIAVYSLPIHLQWHWNAGPSVVEWCNFRMSKEKELKFWEWKPGFSCLFLFCPLWTVCFVDKWYLH